ncbi:MAG: NAD(P)/FAD-dependent oxidoreductase [bacterium]|nr:NAD(P)/FAD-dependent oxidoreductase [bacterium]
MAAGRAAELGANVALIEKNDKLGKKLLITGGGRCNITNAEFEVRKMVANYGPKGKALFGSFSRFGVEDSLDFFHNRGLPTKVEAEKRAFPVSDKAGDVWKLLVNYLKKGGVKIITDSPIKRIAHSDGTITGIVTKSKTYTAKKYIIATGGKSRPETGSTGEGFQWLKDLGHSVEESDPALVPVTIHDPWVKKLSGVSFKEAKLTVYQDGKKQDVRIGKILLTHFGISGPLVLNMSKVIAELYKYAPVTLQLDLYPAMDIQALDKHFLELLGTALNKKIKNNLGGIVPPKMIPVILELTHISPDTEGNSLTREQRLKIISLLKAMPMSVSGFLGVEKAVVTSGGVSLKEIDFKTMQSKLCPNLYLAGDVLNFDRPSGGFSLQICWTTGYLAGENGATA